MSELPVVYHVPSLPPIENPKLLTIVALPSTLVPPLALLGSSFYIDSNIAPLRQHECTATEMTVKTSHFYH